MEGRFAPIISEFNVLMLFSFWASSDEEAVRRTEGETNSFCAATYNRS